MASFVKFYDFVHQLALGTHHFESGVGGGTFKVYLTASTPSVGTHTKKGQGGGAELADITNEHGYAPADIQNDESATGGTSTITAVDVTFTATNGSFGPFRYIVIYNDTATDDNLVGYADYASSITVLDGETFTVNFGASLMTIT